jgi:uncharacterized membrane protein YgcG
MLGTRRRDRRAQELAERDPFRHVRRAADEDVTRFGEELATLHLVTLASPRDDTMRADYQRALDACEDAKAALGRADTAADATGVTRTLADGRFSRACVLAAQSGLQRPERRPPCFFDPAHGPASRDVERLAGGEQPDVRLVRLGDRRVAWFASGPLYAAWAGGWYAELVEDGRMDAERLTMAYAGPLHGSGHTQLPIAAAWNDPGAWEGGGMIGGHDYSGWDGGSGGGGLGGGGLGDGGGGDGGGGGGGD